MSDLSVSLQSQQKYTLPTGVLDCEVSADGRMLYAACMDGVYQVPLDGGEPQRLYEHESYASGVHLDPHRDVLISAGYDGQLVWFDLSRRTIFRRVLAHRFWSWQSARSPDGRLLATVTGQYMVGGEKYEPAAETEPSVKVCDVATGEMLHAFSHVPSVQSVCFSPDSQHVAAGNLLGQIRIWNVKDGAKVADWKTDAFTSWGIIKSHCYIGGIFGLVFSPAGDTLLAAGMGPMTDPMAGNGRQLWQRFAWQENPPRLVDQTHDGESGEGLMEAIAHHPSRPLFLMGGRLRGGDWNAAAFSAEDGRRLQHVNTNYRITQARFTPDGGRVILAGFDKQKGPEKGEYPKFGMLEVFSV
ncbi:MAG: hypothetical protein KDA92_10195 [Planctomycetales bacterium]|nr:hypothetical protein [Planctomycetales bacterium]MCA9171292.1 hypothetical protein [Planctomycetales bacterium]